MKHSGKGKTNNIVLFPKLNERLYTIGMDAFHEQEYKRSYEAFQQLLQAYPEYEEHQEVQLSIVICLLELNKLAEAKEKCKKLLQADIGDYFSLLQIYTSILIQQHEYEEVVHTLETVLEESEVPYDRIEQLQQLLELAKKMAVQEQDYETTIDPAHVQKQIAQTSDLQKQMMYLNEMFSMPVETSFPALQTLLIAESVHPYVKTSILQFLIEQEVHKKVTVKKENHEDVFSVDRLETVFDEPWIQKVLATAEQILANKNPTLYDVIKQIFENYCLVQYPFIPTEEDENIWAAALHHTACRLYGIDEDIGAICKQYQVDPSDISTVTKKIYEAEKYIT